MCQAKPGNRCSGDTLVTIQSLAAKYRETSAMPNDVRTAAQGQLLGKLSKARSDYDTTLKGRRELVRQVSQASDPQQRKKLERRLEYAKKLHAARVLAHNESALTASRKQEISANAAVVLEIASAGQDDEKVEKLRHQCEQRIVSTKGDLKRSVDKAERFIAKFPDNIEGIKTHAQSVASLRSTLLFRQELLTAITSKHGSPQKGA